MERVILGEGIRGDADGRAGHGGRKGEGLEGDGRRGVRTEARPLLAHRPAVHVEGDLRALHRTRALVHQAGGGFDALAARLVVPLHLDARDREVGRAAIGHVHPGQRGGRRQLDVVRAFPSRLLEIGDEDDLAPREKGGVERFLGHAQGGRVARHAEAGPRSGQRGQDGGAVGAGLSAGLRRAIEEDQGHAILWSRLAHGPSRRLEGTCPAPGVAHAVGAVEEHDAHLGAGEDGRGPSPSPEERSREGEGQQDEGQAAHREQQPMAQALPPHRPVGNPLQEHEGRERNRLAARAIGEVYEHGDGEKGEAGQECRGEESHQRTLIMRSRRVRTLASA